MDNSLYPAHASADAADEIDLRQYWRIVSRYKWGILGLALAVTVLAVLVVLSIKPTYRGTSTLLIEQKQAKVMSIEEVYGLDGSNKEYLQTQFEILKSRELAARVVRDLKLDQHPEFKAQPKAKSSFSLDWRQYLPVGHQQNPAPTAEQLFGAVVDRFMARISIAPVRNTQLVKINFDSPDPQLAQQVANTMALAYINSQMEARVALTEQAADWLTSRLGALKGNMEAAERKLQDYREQNSLVNTGEVEGVMALNARQLQDLTERQIQAQFKLSELSKRYGPKHPALVQAQSELNEAEAALGVAKGRAMDVSRKEFRLQELTREVQTNRNLYDTFFTRVKEANEAVKLETANARVVDPAVLPSVPVKPRKSLIVALAFVLSVLLGVMLAFLLDYLDHTFKGADDVEARLGVPLLGLLPLGKFKSKVSVAQPMFLAQDQNSFAEAMRTIRTGVVLSGIDNPHKIVVVTSSVPGEGKTTTSLNLALALGQMERVLLVDADMRRPSVAKACGISGGSTGLSNVVAGAVPLEQCIHHLRDGGIDVMPAGLLPPNPLELLSSKRFAELLNELGERYDRVVIDSAPTLAVSDALVLSSLANAVIYVVKSDSTAFHSARTGIQRLQRVQAPITGVVLNQVDFSRSNKAGGYYGYYDYYGYKSE